ncbi:MAG: hypothetical protein J6A47_08335, partial [Bacilli bacterium]|nr:hypothetical protein [Bacilli bacterium]
AVINPMSAVIAASLSIALAMEPFSWNVIAGGALITISILLAGIIDAKHERHSKLSLENV